MFKTNKINIAVIILWLATILLIHSCKIEKIEPAKTVTEAENPSDTTSNTQNQTDKNNTDKNNITNKNTKFIGSGSGTINLQDIEGEKISIKPGTYSNIRLNSLRNIEIEGLNQVIVENGSIDISNVDGLTLSGITIKNYTQAAINITVSANNLVLKDLKLKNIHNYCIKFAINKKYDGSSQSFSNNIHLIDIQADNIGTLFVSSGGIKNDGFYGLIKGFKLTGSTVKNSPQLAGLTSLFCAEDYIISNNIVDNVNASDKYPNGLNNHTGIFFVQGNGRIFQNKVTNYQGNVVRAWLFSITKPSTVEIYNNIAYNSTRYGAFELQVPPSTENLSSFRPANAKIYNNTIGKLNTGEPKFFEGRLLDLYQTYGNVEIYNNLSFEMRDDILINNMSNPNNTKIIKNYGNKYFKNAFDAVYDLISFKSKSLNIGTL